MQGFNKYYPPDFDPEKDKSLNAYHGKHALGDRARKLDQGILITRFELPFNIWCLNCNSHIGMGVRYNAEKRKIGMYYSTPIFAFRCKCHLCSGWFEIRTDPKNTRYVVEYGARQKMEEWDPEENGGYRIHDTEAASTPLDPLLALEKSTSQQLHTATYVQPRIEELLEHSDRLNSDPYSHSRRVRKYFREEKKVIKEKERKDDELKERYGLPGEMKLVDEKEVGEEAKEWEKERRAARETSSSNLLSNPSTSKMFKPTHLPSTFAEARKLSSLSSSQPKAPSRSLSSSSSKLSASRQASTLSAVLLRNTIKNANSSSSVAKKIDARSTLGILKK